MEEVKLTNDPLLHEMRLPNGKYAPSEFTRHTDYSLFHSAAPLLQQFKSSSTVYQVVVHHHGDHILSCGRFLLR